MAGHIRQALGRYRRDLRLMLGREEQSSARAGVVMLDALRAGRVRRGLIGDRILRIKTLEAMLELILEGTEAHV